MTERDLFFEKAFRRAFGRIEDYRFRGWNESLGCFVESKEHYKMILRRKGLVPFEAAEQLAEEFDSANERRRRSKGELGPRATEILAELRATADKNGNIRLGDRAINALIEIGAIGNDSPYAPEHCFS